MVAAGGAWESECAGVVDSLECGFEHLDALVLGAEFGAEACELLALAEARAHGGAAVGDRAHDAALEGGEVALRYPIGLVLASRRARQGGDHHLAHRGGVVVGRQLARAPHGAMDAAHQLVLGVLAGVRRLGDAGNGDACVRHIGFRLVVAGRWERNERCEHSGGL